MTQGCNCFVKHSTRTTVCTYQHISEHTRSNLSIGRQMKQHGIEKPTLMDNLSALKKCGNKFECLVYEMLLTAVQYTVQELKPSLKRQSHLLHRKLLTSA